jgi:transposase
MGEERQAPELPKDVESLQALVAQLHASNAKLHEQSQVQEKKISVLKQRIVDLCVEVYGPRSEKARYYDPSQGIFGFMMNEDLKRKADKIEAESGTLTVPAHERKKPGRRSEFPDHLMQLRVRHELDDDQRICSCGTLMLDAGILTKKALERIELIFLHVDEICRYKCPCCGHG